MSNRLVFIRRILYRLKRRYGETVDFVTTVSSVLDLETGGKTVSKSGVRVRRAIVMPSVIHREFAYDLAFIATNKNFTYGGHFDTQQRSLIIDRKDLPTDFEIKLGMYFVMGGKRYEVNKVEEFEERAGYMVQGKQVTDLEASNVVEVTAEVGSRTAEVEVDLEP